MQIGTIFLWTRQKNGDVPMALVAVLIHPDCINITEILLCQGLFSIQADEPPQPGILFSYLFSHLANRQLLQHRQQYRLHQEGEAAS
jgi:hypothetical protein